MKVSLFIVIALSLCVIGHAAENDVMSGTYRYMQPQQLQQQPILGRTFISGQQPLQWSGQQQPIVSGVGLGRASWQQVQPKFQLKEQQLKEQQFQQQPIMKGVEQFQQPIMKGVEQQVEQQHERTLPIKREYELPIQREREQQQFVGQQQPIQQWSQPLEQQWQQPLEQAKVESPKPSVVRLNLAPTLRFTSSPSITTSIHSANQFVTPSLTATRHETKLDIPVPSNVEQQGVSSGFGGFGRFGQQQPIQHQQQQPITYQQQQPIQQQHEQSSLVGQEQEQAAVVKSGVEGVKEQEQQPVKMTVLTFRPLFVFPVLRKSLKGSMYFEREQPLQSAALASLDVDNMSDAAKLKLEKFRLKMKMHKLKNLLLATRLANLKMKQEALTNQQAVQKLGWTQQYAIVRDLANKYENQQKFLKMRLGLNALRGRLLQMRVRRFLTNQMMKKQQLQKDQFGSGMMRSAFISHPSAASVIRPWMVRHALKQQRIIASMKNRINNLQSQVLALRAKQSKFALKSGMAGAHKGQFGLTELPVEGKKEYMGREYMGREQAIESDADADADVVNKRMRFSFEGIKTGSDESDEDAQKRKMNVQFDFSYPKRDEATSLARDANLLNAGGFGSIRLVGGGFKSKAVGDKKVTQGGRLNVLLNIAKTVTDLEQDVSKDSDESSDIDERALMKQEKIVGGEQKKMSDAEIDERVEAELKKDEVKESPVKKEQYSVSEQEQEQAELDTDTDVDEQEQERSQQQEQEQEQAN